MSQGVICSVKYKSVLKMVHHNLAEVVILTKFGNFHYGIETKIWTASERFLEQFSKKKFFLKIIPKTFPKQSYPNFYKSLDKNMIKK